MMGFLRFIREVLAEGLKTWRGRLTLILAILIPIGLLLMQRLIPSPWWDRALLGLNLLWIMRSLALKARPWDGSLPAGQRTIARAARYLDLLSALVPRRIANEEIGDAMEVIHAMAKARRPKWYIYLKVATTFFWVGVHTLLLCGERVAGIVKVAIGKGDSND